MAAATTRARVGAARLREHLGRVDENALVWLGGAPAAAIASRALTPAGDWDAWRAAGYDARSVARAARGDEADLRALCARGVAPAVPSVPPEICAACFGGAA